MTVQPVASAGPIFQTDAPSGPFQGMIAPTTPTGSFKRVGENLAGQRILDGLAVQRGRHAGVVAQHAENAAARARGAADRRAHVEGVEQAQLVEMPLDEVGELEQHLLALDTA